MMKFRRAAIAAIILAVVISAAAWQGSARAATVGPNYPSAEANDTSIGTVAWTTGGRLSAVEGNTAGATLAKNVVSNYLTGSNFGFSVPSTAQINGIQLEIYAFATDGSNRADIVDSSVFLLVGGNISGTNHGSNTIVGTAGSWASFGGSSDAWGLSLTGSDVNSIDFGAAASYSNQSSGPGGTESVNVDAMRITITYTIPNATPSAPTLIAPASGATGVSTQPVFQMAATDAEGDNLQYVVTLYSADCIGFLGQFNQSLSQTGWSGQDQAGGTAYTGSPSLESSTVASYTYTGTLANSTTYCWRGNALDPTGSNNPSIPAAYQTFTTASPNAAPSAPSVTAPANGATGVSVSPVFQLAASDAENDHLQYNIDVYASDCSTPVAFFDQSTSQTGWSGQDQAGGTAYTGSSTLASSTVATYTASGTFANSTTYCWRASTIDPAGSSSYGAWSGYLTFTTAAANAAPAAPTLSQPADTATGIALRPVFKLSTTDANSDPVQYSIDLCADALCGSIIDTFDQTVAVAGWSGQDAASGTAFSTGTTIGSSRTATYTYFGTALAPATTYWWRGRAQAISGVTSWSTYSAIFSFTTASSSTTLMGGVTITGGVNF